MRKRVHAAVKGLDEELKWNVPFFTTLLTSMKNAGLEPPQTPTFACALNAAMLATIFPFRGELPAAASFARSVKEAAKQAAGLAQGKTPAKKPAGKKKSGPRKTA